LALLLLALIPALLLGRAFGGRTTWIHAHDDEGLHAHVLHEHVLPENRGHELATLDSWHDAHHHQEDRDRPDDERKPAPEGLVIALPGIVASPCQPSSAKHTCSLHAQLPSAELGPQPRAVGVTCRPHVRFGWPPQTGERSGVAALLRSSRAILI
jgi:hypothetical protein